jgi:hypothetical protein
MLFPGQESETEKSVPDKQALLLLFLFSKDPYGIQVSK